MFANYEAEKLNDVFLTLQTVLQEIIRRDGSNKFHAPHIGKARLRREGNLPNVIALDDDALEKVETHIAAANANANANDNNHNNDNHNNANDNADNNNDN